MDKEWNDHHHGTKPLHKAFLVTILLPHIYEIFAKSRHTCFDQSSPSPSTPEFGMPMVDTSQEARFPHGQ
jgi:hypothetical protein